MVKSICLKRLIKLEGCIKKIRKKIYNIVAIGEILWDIFPNGKKLGRMGHN